MRSFLIVCAAALALAGAARAEVRAVALTPSADLALPFWCDWTYDWEERCWRLDGDRLAVGGDVDKVWRAALRFSLSSVPAGAAVLGAELTLWFDGTCLAPRKTSRECDGRPFDFAVHPIFSHDWDAEREVEIGRAAGFASLPAFARPQWLTFNVTDAVADNSGLLVKLTDGTEEIGVGGPLFASSRAAAEEVRPTLTVWYLTP